MNEYEQDVIPEIIQPVSDDEVRLFGDGKIGLHLCPQGLIPLPPAEEPAPGLRRRLALLGLLTVTGSVATQAMPAINSSSVAEAAAIGKDPIVRAHPGFLPPGEHLLIKPWPAIDTDPAQGIGGPSPKTLDEIKTALGEGYKTSEFEYAPGLVAQRYDSADGKTTLLLFGQTPVEVNPDQLAGIFVPNPDLKDRPVIWAAESTEGKQLGVVQSTDPIVILKSPPGQPDKLLKPAIGLVGYVWKQGYVWAGIVSGKPAGTITEFGASSEPAATEGLFPGLDYEKASPGYGQRQAALRVAVYGDPKYPQDKGIQNGGVPPELFEQLRADIVEVMPLDPELDIKVIRRAIRIIGYLPQDIEDRRDIDFAATVIDHSLLLTKGDLQSGVENFHGITLTPETYRLYKVLLVIKEANGYWPPVGASLDNSEFNGNNARLLSASRIAERLISVNNLGNAVNFLKEFSAKERCRLQQRAWLLPWGQFPCP